MTRPATFFAWRVLHGISQRAAGSALGCSKDTVAAWETRNPRYAVLAAEAWRKRRAPIVMPADLAAWRQGRGWSLRRAAAELGCDRESLAKWERIGPPRWIGLACAELGASARIDQRERSGTDDWSESRA